MGDKETTDCKLRYGLRVSGADNTPSKRVTWCCRFRPGLFLKQWKCVGYGKAGCPLTDPNELEHEQAKEYISKTGG